VVRAVRVQTLGRTQKPELREYERVHSPVTQALRSRRPAFFDGRFVDTPVYDGESVGHGHRIEGPAIVEERFTTIVVYPGWTAELDRESLELEVRKNSDRCEEFERLLAARTDEFNQQRYRWNEERDTLQSALETLRVQRNELEQDALGLEAESMRLTSLVQELESRLSPPAPRAEAPEVEVVLNEEFFEFSIRPARGIRHNNAPSWRGYPAMDHRDGEPVVENNCSRRKSASESFVLR
jgi:hypothetical protein